MATAYPNTELHINGAWKPAAGGETLDVINPATEDVIGTVAHARQADLDEALEAAEKGFREWKTVPAFDRYKVMRKAADLMRERAEEIATIMTMEQGKPLFEAKIETLFGADIIDWFAEEARRTYGRVVPARADGITQLVVKEPVGPVAAFTPWNFPINQAVRKTSGAVAAGCSIILKGPEETPAACAALIRCFVDAGLPDGVVNLVYGTPAEISEYLIPHRTIRKVTFTGSTAVGKQLAALAGEHMKRVTMELGGHSPAIVFEDADVETALKVLTANKFRNAGQVCVSPTRFLVHEKHYKRFVDGFTEFAESLPVGDGLEEDTKMGPLAHDRRVEAIEGFVTDAVGKGATVNTGGKRKGNKGYFFEPTVLTDVPMD
ncbi:MAG: NAD-dependent succinate-semialdehyde dehydrogenase, partial [Alphaproteobacteria bacterium]|nr:NAD-dependent succinate-semialdehyde dehydrogenase [Alphaproteobacteria bacterium]